MLNADDKMRLMSAKAELAELNARIEKSDRELAAISWLLDFVCLDPVLEKPSVSISHSMREDAAKGKAIFMSDEDWRSAARDLETEIFSKAHYFVVQHDWAKAFEGAHEYEEGEFRLPFEVCVFEFRISGHRAIVPAIETDEGVVLSIYVESPVGWYVFAMSYNLATKRWLGPVSRDSPSSTEKREEKIFSFMAAQVRAICIALEAEVAEANVIAAPPKLNRAREKAGKPPVADYGMIDLSRRLHGPHTEGTGTGTKKRLHFRRGHWRHYEDHRTWIRWTLVGNPDLGFINRQYRL